MKPIQTAKMISRGELWLAFVLAFALSGCMQRPLSEQELIGNYRAEIPGEATELLQLLPGGACIQTIQLRTGAIYEARGTWRFDEKKARLYLKGTRQTLTPAKELNPQLADPPSDATLGTPVYRRPGGIAIMLHKGIDYRKEATT